MRDSRPPSEPEGLEAAAPPSSRLSGSHCPHCRGWMPRTGYVVKKEVPVSILKDRGPRSRDCHGRAPVEFPGQLAPGPCPALDPRPPQSWPRKETTATAAPSKAGLLASRACGLRRRVCAGPLLAGPSSSERQMSARRPRQRPWLSCASRAFLLAARSSSPLGPPR